jgi:hypothetical protein
MAPPHTNVDASSTRPEADLAQAFKDLARGERTATALEQHLDALEERIEELLASAQENQKSIEAGNDRPSQRSSSSASQENGEPEKIPA